MQFYFVIQLFDSEKLDEWPEEMFLMYESYKHKLFSQSGDGADALIQGYQMADGKHAMVSTLPLRILMLHKVLQLIMKYLSF